MGQLAARLREDFFVDDFFVVFFGARLPARRASERPMATACFLLVTFLADDFFEPRPDVSVPFLRSLIAFATFLLAPLLYFRPPLFFAAMIVFLRS